jgi:hypothetical protein
VGIYSVQMQYFFLNICNLQLVESEGAGPVATEGLVFTEFSVGVTCYSCH